MAFLQFIKCVLCVDMGERLPVASDTQTTSGSSVYFQLYYSSLQSLDFILNQKPINWDLISIHHIHLYSESS
jgi:hypothetical protein